MKKWPIVLALILTYVFFAILLNSVGAVILQVIQHYDVTKQSAGTLEGFKDLPIAIVSFCIASFLPRIGYKCALQFGLLLVSIACFAMPLLPGFMTTKLFFLILGISFALVKVSVYALIGTITDNQQQHASLLNTIEGFFMVGVLLGNWVFSLYISDSPYRGNEWLTVYWPLGGLSIATLLVIYVISMPDATTPSLSRFWHDFKDMITLITHSLVLVFILSTFMYVLIEQSITTWLPTFNHEILQFPPSMSVQAAGIFAGSLAIGRIAAGRVLKYIHWHTLLSVCIIGMGGLLLCILTASKSAAVTTPITWKTAPLTALLLPMVGLIMAPIYPAINSIMLSSLPKSQHAAMTGLIVIFSALGGTTGSYITGNLFNILGGHQAFYVLLVPSLILYFTTFGFKSYARAVDG